jgi:integrase
MFDGLDHRAHALIIDTASKKPSIIGSLYEASASRRYRSPNTFESKMRGAQVLVSWALDTGFDLDRRLMNGTGLTERDILGFSWWLEENLLGGGETFKRTQIDTFNGLISEAACMVRWAIVTFPGMMEGQADPGVLLEVRREKAKREWKEVKKKRVREDVAPDLTDEQIDAIEAFLVSKIQVDEPERRWVRTYLIWRLALEFGFRIGEILALRLQDCPSRQSPLVKIVRVEERSGPPDPRGRLAPRPKTLSRSMRSPLQGSGVPLLISKYQGEHRVRLIVRPGQCAAKRPILNHDFLLVSESGKPLPRSTAFSYARNMSREVGFHFTWHLCRHAFFNRAYASVDLTDDISVRNIGMNDLLYWGGWSDPGSLKIYARSAIRRRAQEGKFDWCRSIDPGAFFYAV